MTRSRVKNDFAVGLTTDSAGRLTTDHTITSGGSIVVGSDGSVTGSEGGQIDLRGNDGTTSVYYFDIAGTPEIGRIFTVTDNTNLQIGQLAGTGGDVQFFAGGSRKARFDSDGLKFNSDTAAANALDDYEEGSFTVTLRGSTAEPATLVSDASNYYTKIGNVVKARISLENVDTTGYAGDVSFGGLPFTSVNNTRTIGTLIGYRSMTTSATATTGVVAMIFPNSSAISTREGDSGSAWLTPQHSPSTGRYFFVDIVYMTA